MERRKDRIEGNKERQSRWKEGRTEQMVRRKDMQRKN
jgi:hypothetical protein